MSRANAHTACCLVAASLFFGCSTANRVPQDLDKPVPVRVGKLLLREFVAIVEQAVGTRVELDDKVNEFSEAWIDVIPKPGFMSPVPLRTSLDIVKNQLALKYEMKVDWSIKGHHVKLFYSGTDDEYHLLKQRMNSRIEARERDKEKEREKEK